MKAYTSSNTLFNPEKIAKDFKILSQKIKNNRLCYLDNSATVQKPQCVIDAMSECMQNEYAAIHRGVHYLSYKLTEKCEKVREQIKTFINAKNSREIVFTRGTTDGLNLLASSLGELLFKQQKNPAVLISAMEHHANLIVWQKLCEKYQAELKIIPIDSQGNLQLDNIDELIKNCQIVSITHCSNVLGTINDCRKIFAKAHQENAVCILDGAQAIAHVPVDVQDLDCDFYVFSGHKIYGPTGIGVLYGRAELLEKMPPSQYGGSMISNVSFEKSSFADYPTKFEAGTPPIVEIIGLSAALEWIQENGGIYEFARYEDYLRLELEEQLRKIEDISIYGSAKNKAAIVSFNLKNIHPHDVATFLDDYSVAVRAGHHCAQPLTQLLGVTATVRASFAAYNCLDDVNQLVNAVKKCQEFFQ